MMRDGEALPEPTVPSTASTNQSHARQRPGDSCFCPANSGEDCPATLDECLARTLVIDSLREQRTDPLRSVFDGIARRLGEGLLLMFPPPRFKTEGGGIDAAPSAAPAHARADPRRARDRDPIHDVITSVARQLGDGLLVLFPPPKARKQPRRTARTDPKTPA
jgi:hypothetical protein